MSKVPSLSLTILSFGYRAELLRSDTANVPRSIACESPSLPSSSPLADPPSLFLSLAPRILLDHQRQVVQIRDGSSLITTGCFLGYNSEVLEKIHG